MTSIEVCLWSGTVMPGNATVFNGKMGIEAATGPRYPPVPASGCTCGCAGVRS